MTGESFEIIFLAPEEWPAYRRIRLEALETNPEAFGATLESSLLRPDSFWRERLEGAARQDGQWLRFARVGDDLVGLVGAMVTPEPTVADVISMFVRPTCRGKGVGEALVRAILDDLKSAGIERAQLDVRPGQKAAIRLYERCGFRIVGDHPNGELIMSRRL